MSDASSKRSISWNPFVGVLLIIALYLFAPFIGQNLVSLFSAVAGLELSQTVAQFLYIVVVEAVTIAALLYYLRRNKAGIASIGLGKFKFKHLGIGLAVYPLYFILFAATVVVASQLIPALDINQEQQLGFDNVTGLLPLTLTFISLVVLPPIIEELTIRGMIFTSLRSKLNLAWATIVTSLLFAAAHLPAGGDAGPLYIAAIDTFLLSLVLCVVRDKTDSLWPCITLHALKNGIAFISLYIVVAA